MRKINLEKCKKYNTENKGITLIALVITIIVLLILAGITINALTGSDSAPAKANEAEQKNDIGTITDDVALKVQNAHLDAYDEIYVQGKNEVSLNGASTKIGQEVIDAVIKSYGGALTRDDEGKIKCEKNIGKATIQIEQEAGKDAKITIKTRDDEKKGTISLDGGVLKWKGSESATPDAESTTHNERNLMTGKTIVTNAEADQDALDWPTLKKIAEIIEEEATIDNSTTEVLVSNDGKNYKIGIGDTATVYYNGDPKIVRILGFNHDETNGETGISFEFKDFLGDNRGINGSNTNAGGWGNSAIRSALNDTSGTYLPNIKDAATGGKAIAIKEVNKPYNKGSSTYTNSTSSGDKLWLLSCAEIWPSSSSYSSYSSYYNKEEEGACYAYYNQANVSRIKNRADWWLRSPRTGSSNRFCFVRSDGTCTSSSANNSSGVAPGFTI